MIKQLSKLAILCTLMVACHKKQVEPQPQPTQTLIGNYKGSFQHCEAVGCYDVDTTFNIELIGGKTYLHFGKINKEIVLLDPISSTTVPVTFLSTDTVWIDSAHTTGYYPISGDYLNDSVHVVFCNPLIPTTYYKNLLSGKKY